MPGHYRHEHTDFTVKDFHEQLIKRHNYTLGFSVTKLCLHGAGPARPRPSARHIARNGRIGRCRGMMLHQDGSRHVWSMACLTMA